MIDRSETEEAKEEMVLQGLQKQQNIKMHLSMAFVKGEEMSTWLGIRLCVFGQQLTVSSEIYRANASVKSLDDLILCRSRIKS